MRSPDQRAARDAADAKRNPALFAARTVAEAALRAAETTLATYPRLANSLHADAVRELPEFQRDRKAVARAFSDLKRLNALCVNA